MKKSVMKKETLREVKRTYTRFLSILLMVALGVFVLVGLSVTGPIMRTSVEKKVKQSNMHDLHISTSMGLEDKDLHLLGQLDEMEDVELRYSVDIREETGKFNMRIYSVPDRISKALVREGRLPNKEGELALDYYLKGQGYSTGDTIVFEKEKDKYNLKEEEEETNLKRYSFQIVGFVETPEHVENNFVGTSSDGAILNGFAYILPEDFNLDFPTDAYILFSSMRGKDTWDETYVSFVRDREEEVKLLLANRPKEKLEDLRGDIQDEIEEGKEKILDAKEKLRDGEETLKNAQKEIIEGEKDYKKGEKTFYSEISKAQDSLDSGKKELDEAKSEIDENKKKLEDAKEQLAEGKKTLSEKEQEYYEGREEYATGLSQFEEGQKKLQDAKIELESGRKTLEESKVQLEDGKRQLAEGEKQLAEGKKELQEKEPELRAGEKEYESGLAQYNQGIGALEASKKLLDESEQQIQEAEIKILAGEDALKQAEKEIQVGKVLLTQLRKQKSDLEALLSITISEEEKKEIQGKIQEIQQKIDKIEAEITAGEQAYALGKIELEKGKKELEIGKTQLAKGKEEYNAGKKKLDESKVQLDFAKKQLEEGKKQLEEGKNKLLQGEAEIEANRDKLTLGETEYKKGLSEFEAGEKEYESGKRTLEDSKSQLEDAKKQLDDGKYQLDDGKRELEENEGTYYEGREKLRAGESKYESGLEAYKEGKKQLAEEATKGKKDLASAFAELQKGKKEYTSGLREFEEESSDAYEEIAQGESELEEAADILEILKQPSYTIQSRPNNPSVYQYIGDSYRIDLLAKIFPIFFFAIAMLVSSTTMTRMVDEQRVQIGTLKALGYSNREISKKYFYYGAMAAFIGGILGMLAGNFFVAEIIAEAYSTGTIMDALIVDFYPVVCIGALLIGIVCTGFVALLTVNRALQENAAELMRPKPPASGMRILLERFTPLWKRMSFLQKVTARNIFRYKKRMLMTLIGVMGCTALLVLGFGIDTSIQGIIEKQYGELTKYNMLLLYEKRLSTENYREYQEKLEEDRRVSSSTKARFTMITTAAPKTLEQSVSTIIPKNLKEFEKVVVLRNPRSGEKIPLSDNGVVITDKLAELKKIKVGDDFYVTDDEKQIHQVKVSGIVEGYIGHYMYMTPTYYTAVFGEGFETNADLITLRDASQQGQDSFIEDYLAEKVVISSITFDYMRDMMDQMVSSISLIVFIIVVASSLLASVVLYNLTNINIEERQRELSTIKVLGFYSGEVTSYVYRETWILTILGIFIGFFVGKFLHYGVMKVVVPDSARLSSSLNLWNYLIPSIITIIVSLVVMFFIHRQLKRIDMVEALKAVE